MPFALDGSAVANVVRALTREHARAGGHSTAVTSHNRSASFPHADMLTVDYTQFCPQQYFTRREYLADMAHGLVLRERPHGGQVFAPAVEALAVAQPDWVVVHEGHYAAAALPRLRRALPNAGVALHAHNRLSRSYLRPELSYLLKQADLVLCVSKFSAQRVRRRAWVSSRKVRPVLNGVDHELFRPGCEVSAHDGPVRLLYVGQVAPHKGVHLLLQALERSGSGAVAFELRIVGSARHGATNQLDSYERALRDAAAALPCKVAFEPFAAQGALPDVYRWADAVCVPSVVPEAFGLVVAEAMACGVHVLASRVGALPEVLGGAGTLVQRDAAAWAVALGRLDRDVLRMGAARSLDRAAGLSWANSYRAMATALSMAQR